MNILYWTDGFPPRIGGIETQGLYLAKEISKRHHNCTVITNQDTPTVPLEEIIDGVNVFRVNFHIFREFEINGQKALRQIEKKLLPIFEMSKPDVIHLFSFYQNHSSLTYLLLRKKLPYPVILTLHTLPDPRNFRFLARFFESAEHISCVSQPVFEQVKIYAPSVINKLSLVTNALPTPVLDPSPLACTPPIILCLGRFSEEKGFDLAIKAFSQVREHFPDARLILAGSGPMQTIYEELIHTLGLSESVTFTGAISIGNVPALINQVSLVLMPSHIESFGLVALEAAHMERPVIASAVGGLLEVLAHGETGILIPPNDVNALFKAIVELLNNPNLAIELGKKARIRALHQFSSKKMADSYEQLYSTIVKNATKETVLE